MRKTSCDAPLVRKTVRGDHRDGAPVPRATSRSLRVRHHYFRLSYDDIVPLAVAHAIVTKARWHFRDLYPERSSWAPSRSWPPGRRSFVMGCYEAWKFLDVGAEAGIVRLKVMIHSAPTVCNQPHHATVSWQADMVAAPKTEALLKGKLRSLTAPWLTLRRARDVGRAETFSGIRRSDEPKVRQALLARGWRILPHDWDLRRPNQVVYREHDLLVARGMLEVGGSTVKAELRLYPYSAGSGCDPSSRTLKQEVSWRAQGGRHAWLPQAAIRRAQRAFLSALTTEARLSPVRLDGWRGTMPQPRRGKFQEVIRRLLDSHRAGVTQENLCRECDFIGEDRPNRPDQVLGRMVDSGELEKRWSPEGWVYTRK